MSEEKREWPSILDAALDDPAATAAGAVLGAAILAVPTMLVCRYLEASPVVTGLSTAGAGLAGAGGGATAVAASRRRSVRRTATSVASAIEGELDTFDRRIAAVEGRLGAGDTTVRVVFPDVAESLGGLPETVRQIRDILEGAPDPEPPPKATVKKGKGGDAQPTA